MDFMVVCGFCLVFFVLLFLFDLHFLVWFLERKNMKLEWVGRWEKSEGGMIIIHNFF